MNIIDPFLNFSAEYINPIIVCLLIILVAMTLYSVCAPRFWKKHYNGAVRLLYKIRKGALYLSHGGLHLLLFFACFLLGCAMIGMVKNENIASFHQVVYTFYGDTIKNYKMSYLNLTKDMSRKDRDSLNENDIIIEYGYIRDSTTNREPISLKAFKNVDSVDLVSKVRMVVQNERPLVIEDNPISPAHFYHDYTQVHNRVKYSNKDRFIYYYTTKDSKNHSYDHSFAAKDLEKNYDKINPYYSFWLGLNFESTSAPEDSCIIRFVFTQNGKNNRQEGIGEPINIEKIIPEPSEITASDITFKGKDKITEVIKNGGIYIRAVDPVIKAQSDERQIIYTVLAGTIFAFCLDLLVQIVIKWKRLKKNEKD